LACNTIEEKAERKILEMICRECPSFETYNDGIRYVTYSILLDLPLSLRPDEELPPLPDLEELHETLSRAVNLPLPGMDMFCSSLTMCSILWSSSERVFNFLDPLLPPPQLSMPKTKFSNWHRFCLPFVGLHRLFSPSSIGSDPLQNGNSSSSMPEKREQAEEGIVS